MAASCASMRMRTTLFMEVSCSVATSELLPSLIHRRASVLAVAKVDSGLSLTKRLVLKEAGWRPLEKASLRYGRTQGARRRVRFGPQSLEGDCIVPHRLCEPLLALRKSGCQRGGVALLPPVALEERE